MVWSCCSTSALGPILIIDGHVNGESYSRLLEDTLQPTIGAMFDDPRTATFQHDNAPAHRSAQARAKLAELDIPTIDWPAYSPDLNPIETLWSLLKRRIRARPHPPTTIPDLRIAILEEWGALADHEDEWREHLANVRGRLQEVVSHKGFPTKY